MKPTGESGRLDRWRWALDGLQRRQRPEQPQRVTFAALADRRTTFDPARLIPIESLRPGDEQALVAEAPSGHEPLVVELVPHVESSALSSIVASAMIHAVEPLPWLRELLLVGAASRKVPDPETLRNLPRLETLWAGQGPYANALHVESLPADVLRHLAIERALLRLKGGPAGPDALVRFGHLRHLVLNGAYPTDSLAPLAALTELVALRADARIGWPALAGCAKLEDVEAYRARLTDLRPLRTWTRLRRLTVSMGGLTSLEGIAAFEALDRLTLIALRLDRLSGLSGLPRLEELRLIHLRRLHDLGPLGRMPALRRLEIRGGRTPAETIRVNSLRPLATATSLEDLVLDHATVDDRDLRPLVELPALRRVALFGELEREATELRASRPDVEVSLRKTQIGPTGSDVEQVTIHPPLLGRTRWWVLQDLTDVLDVETNAQAEALLRAATADVDPGLAARLEFDTEADAMGVDAPTEADIRSVAGIINQLAGMVTKRI
jgi:hypothetical protein